MSAGLFEQPIEAPPPSPAIEQQRPKRGFELRQFQREDADAVEAAWAAGHQGVLCVQATGLGKSVMGAEVAGNRPEGTRALIVVDSTALARDLVRTVREHLGRAPGIFTGETKAHWQTAGVLVATKQCLCAGEHGDESYRMIDWSKFDRVVVDECESGLADSYAAMLLYMQDCNPSLKMMGMTATPLPSEGRNIGDLFPYAASEPGPLYRDLQWAYLEGWLVKPKQAMIRTSMDFSSVKINPNAMGEKDYSEQDQAQLLMDQDEQEWLKLGNAIYQIAKGHTAIVVCPNNTDVADYVCGYIEGAARRHGEQDVAQSIHRSLTHANADDLVDRFKSGEFSIGVSVKMFEKGFDYDAVDMVIMLRRTKSLRLYTQAAGRGTRPLQAIRPALHDAPDKESRRRIIAESAKPHCVIVDCVGVNDEAKDILGVIDILGHNVREDIRERVRANMLAKQQNETDETQQDDSDDQTEQGVDMGDAAREARDEINQEIEKRAAVSANVDVHYEEEDPRKKQHGDKTTQKPKRGTSTEKQVKLLVALGVKPKTALAYNKRQAGKVIDQYKKKEVVPDWRRVRRWERGHLRNDE